MPFCICSAPSRSWWDLEWRNFEQHSPDTSTLIYQVFEGFKQEGINMPYTMEDFRRDFIKEHYTAEQRLEGLTPEQRLQGLTPEEIEAALERLKKQTIERKRKKKK